VTFIEYALLAAIAVVIGFIFRTALSSAFNTLLDNVKQALNTTDQSR
jgi:Flp pilus assembly pilin Flp